MSEEQEVQGADSTAEFKPVVNLQKVVVDTGEKDEKEIYKCSCRLYRYMREKDPPEWATRGVGQVRFLKNIEKGQTRILLREGKTLKVRMNHMIQPDASLTPKAGSEEVCFQWYAKDYAEEEPWEGLFAIKFANADLAQDFKKQYENAQKINKMVADGAEPESEPAPITAAPKVATSPSVQTNKTTNPPANKDNKSKTTKNVHATSSSTSTATSPPSTTTTTTNKNANNNTTTTTNNNNTNNNNNEKKESAWRKLNRTFKTHVEKDFNLSTTTNADWSTSMSEYLIFAHKLRNDKSQAPTRILSSNKPIYGNLNKAFHRWVLSQTDPALDADWTPPIRDYLIHAKKINSEIS